MIDLNATNEWQHRDPDTGLVFPWYTKPALDEIVTWDLKDKKVFEYGCGASSIYFAAKGAKIYGCDVSGEYLEAINSALVRQRIIGGLFYQVEDRDLYISFPSTRGILFDIIIVDGDPVEWRDGCIMTALKYLKPEGVLIIDNWDQPSVWLPSRQTKENVLSYPHKIFKQPGHPDWQTLIAWKDH